jgi:hypothetical protein
VLPTAPLFCFHLYRKVFLGTWRIFFTGSIMGKNLLNTEVDKRNSYIVMENVFLYVSLTMHIDNLCNENQIDALFIYNLFHQTTTTCFERIYCPSSEGIYYYIYIYIYSPKSRYSENA